MVGYKCPICKDNGFVVVAGPDGEPLWERGKHGQQTQLRKCDCQGAEAASRRIAYLHSIDGLHAREREMAFERLTRKGNAHAIEQVEEAALMRRGFLALSGAPGTGKTSLLICAVNSARERNVPAVYVVMTALLDYLRAAYNPLRADLLDFDRRWDLLIKAEVLAIDEVDEFSATPWAMERFLRLIDERWRAMDSRLTLLATNLDPAALPDKVHSRLQDGRAHVLYTGGPDMRPFLGADDR